MATIYPFRTSNFAQTIYIGGTQRFTARDGYTGIPVEYHEPVKQYAAANYTLYPYAYSYPNNRTEQLDIALANGWINQQEYDDTVAYIVY
jgi:hypothetical protein